MSFKSNWSIPENGRFMDLSSHTRKAKNEHVKFPLAPLISYIGEYKETASDFPLRSTFPIDLTDNVPFGK